MLATHGATYRDAHGELATVLTNDGVLLRLTLAGVELSGGDFDALEVVGAPDPAALARFTFLDGSLCAFALAFELPIAVVAHGLDVPATLAVQVEIGPPQASLSGTHRSLAFERVRLVLAVVDQRYAASADGSFEYALEELRRGVPPGWYLKVCYGCALSDYSPGGSGLFGTLMCFREHKAAYRRVTSKAALFRIGWGPSVQETHVCPEYEPRLPGTGYRG